MIFCENQNGHLENVQNKLLYSASFIKVEYVCLQDELESNHIFWNVEFHHLCNFNVSFVQVDLRTILVTLLLEWLTKVINV